MKTKHVMAWNRETGERLAVFDLSKPKWKEPNERRFVMIFVDVPSVTHDERLTDFDRTFLLWVVTEMDEQNELRKFQDEMAVEFKSSQPRISRVLKRLREAEYLDTPRDGVIQVNPMFAWKDKLALNKQALKHGLPQNQPLE